MTMRHELCVMQRWKTFHEMEDFSCKTTKNGYIPLPKHTPLLKTTYIVILMLTNQCQKRRNNYKQTKISKSETQKKHKCLILSTQNQYTKSINRDLQAVTRTPAGSLQKAALAICQRSLFYELVATVNLHFPLMAAKLSFIPGQKDRMEISLTWRDLTHNLGFVEWTAATDRQNVGGFLF